MDILFVAAENGALPEGKVGGIGDVIRDLPPALAARGCRVTIVTPSHGYLHLGAAAKKMAACRFRFGGDLQSADLFDVAPAEDQPGVLHRVIHHPALGAFDTTTGKYRIYTHDPPDRPFYTDATRFAFFNGAVAAALAGGMLGPFDVVHLHDWHAALVVLLARYHPDFTALEQARWVFSIHNLAFQGIRPLRGSESALETWFPELHYDWTLAADPRWPDCINPMAVGIRLADRVHTVSPSYAAEILQPGRKPQFYGGEGLETDLNRVHSEGRLIGILNGCCYPRQQTGGSHRCKELLDMIRGQVIRWSSDARTVPAALFVAFARTLAAASQFGGPDVLLSGVGRIGEQKMLLLRQAGRSGKSGLVQILEGLGPRAMFILLGSGDADYEMFLTATAGRHDNFIFVNGFADGIARALYTSGDLFLMPSSYEPCGLSQMLAMREGQPCVVHAVGGLKDTVQDRHDGFSFSGDSLEQQVDRFVQTTLEAVALKRENPAAWQVICNNAAAARFTWEQAADRCLRQLYDLD